MIDISGKNDWDMDGAKRGFKHQILLYSGPHVENGLWHSRFRTDNINTPFKKNTKSSLWVFLAIVPVNHNESHEVSKKSLQLGSGPANRVANRGPTSAHICSSLSGR